MQALGRSERVRTVAWLVQVVALLGALVGPTEAGPLLTLRQRMASRPDVGVARVRVGLLRMPLSADALDAERLQAAAEGAGERLYVLLEGNWGGMTRPEAQKRLLFVYDQLGISAPALDVRVILPGPKAWLAHHATDVEAILACEQEQPAIAQMLTCRKQDGLPELQVQRITAPCPAQLTAMGWGEADCENLPEGSFENVVLGGTFDRIHAGHKLLLAMSALCAQKRLLVGVSRGPLLDNKELKDLVHPIALRTRRLFRTLYSMRPSVAYQIVPIDDPFGPSITDPNLQCIVVSKETERGGQSVNKRRVEKGMNSIHVDVVDLVGPEDSDEANKVSSTGLRKKVLGAFCGAGVPSHCLNGGEQGGRDWVRRTRAPGMPYCIGLTGGIASGKSTIVAYLQEKYRVAVVDCDKLGHAAYLKGTGAYDKLVEAFGAERIIHEASGEVDRRKLGGLVFSDPKHMDTLNSIVWPAIRDLAVAEMRELAAAGAEVCVMEAAVLLEAAWDDITDEVWVAFVPEAVAKERLMARNALAEDEALKRIRSQMTNPQRIARSHVLISNHRASAETYAQVDSAWAGVALRRECKLADTGAALPSKRPLADGAAAETGSDLLAKWNDLCGSLGVSDLTVRAEWWRKLRALYTGPGRFYHTLTHLDELLAKLEKFRGLCQRVPLVTAAIFFHDAIYDATKQDNEEVSAQLWEDFAANSGASALTPDDVATVALYIRRTAKHHGQGAAEGDLALFLDMDLSILGASPSRYAQVSRAGYGRLGNLESGVQRRG